MADPQNTLTVTAMRQHGTVSVLQALYFMEQRRSMHGMFMYLPCQDIYERNKGVAREDQIRVEMKDGALNMKEGSIYTDLDFLFVAKGRIGIAEVKSDPNGFSDDEISKLKIVAAELRPDEMVLAAVGKTWPPDVAKKIEDLKQELGKVGVSVTPMLLEWAND